MEKKLISISCSIFLFLGAVITAPFSIKETYAAEIGLVGALAGETTLWEIAGTLFAGAGLILANNDIQQEAINDLGSNSYTLDSLVQSGKINVPEGGSSALNPEDWDWSGLESDLANNTSSKDRKILEGVFGQTGGSSPSGGNDNDQWYKKFIRWVKSGVYQGAYMRSQYINTNNGQIELGLAYLAQALSSYFQDNVTEEIPTSVKTNISISDIQGYCFCQRNGSYNGIHRSTEIEIPKKTGKNFKVYFYYPNSSIKGNIKAYFGNCDNASVSYGDIEYNYEEVTYTQTKTETRTISGNFNAGPYEGFSAPPSSNYYLITQSVDDVTIFCSGGIHTSLEEAQQAHQAYVQGGMVNTSPDIMTPTGPAVNSPGVTWVPTPYIDDGEHLEIVPQPAINTYITTINNPENNPTPEYIAEVWTDSIDPFVGNQNTDPNVTPVPNPNITTVPRPNPNPNVTPIPDVEPGGNDNPITVTQPDPMPVIEGGNADLPQLWDFFPFCIPGDLVEIYKLFEIDASQRMAPAISWRFYVPDMGIDYTFNLDLSPYNSAAEIFRRLFLLVFIASLLVGTRNLIWS